jgi:hypothetical protein
MLVNISSCDMCAYVYGDSAASKYSFITIAILALAMASWRERDRHFRAAGPFYII